MAFNISRFKSTLDKYGGPGRSSLFEVTITKANEPNSALTNQELTFFCTSINLPGIQIQNQQFSAVGQLPLNFPSKMENTPITARFMVDSDHQVLSFFHSWIQKVLNYSTAAGPFIGVGDNAGNTQLPYELGYKDEYACSMVIKHYSLESKENKYYSVTLDNVYPYVVGDIDLAWESQNEFMILPVTFSYDRINYSGAALGTQAADNRSSKGLLEALGDLAVFGSTVRQTILQGRPRSIQDAVNRLTTIRNSYSGLSDFFNNDNTKNPETGSTGLGGGSGG